MLGIRDALHAVPGRMEWSRYAPLADRIHGRRNGDPGSSRRGWPGISQHGAPGGQPRTSQQAAPQSHSPNPNAPRQHAHRRFVAAPSQPGRCWLSPLPGCLFSVGRIGNRSCLAARRPGSPNCRPAGTRAAARCQRSPRSPEPTSASPSAPAPSWPSRSPTWCSCAPTRSRSRGPARHGSQVFRQTLECDRTMRQHRARPLPRSGLARFADRLPSRPRHPAAG